MDEEVVALGRGRGGGHAGQWTRRQTHQSKDKEMYEPNVDKKMDMLVRVQDDSKQINGH